MCSGAEIGLLFLLCTLVGVCSQTLPRSMATAFAFLAVLSTFSDVGRGHIHCGHYEHVGDPYRPHEIVVIAMLVVASGWWKIRRPTPRRALRSIAIQAATVAIAATGLNDMPLVPVALVAGTVLAACLVLEVRLDVDPLARATVRSIGPGLARTACAAAAPRSRAS